MSGRRWLVIIIGAISGACFAALAARCLGAAIVPPHHYRITAIVYAAVTAVLSYFAFRAAISGRTDEASFFASLWGGFAGAVAGLIVLFAAYVMFRDTVPTYIARPLGIHLSQITFFRLILASLLLGFAAGFALRTKTRQREDAPEEE